MSDNETMDDAAFASVDFDALVQKTKTSVKSSDNSADNSDTVSNDGNAQLSRHNSSANKHNTRGTDSASKPKRTESDYVKPQSNVSDLADIGEDEASDNDNNDNTESTDKQQSSGNKRKRLKRVDEIKTNALNSDTFFDDQEYDSAEDDMDNFIVDDTNGAYKDKQRRTSIHTTQSLQPPFQSTATVYSNKRRYMCWNTIGTILCRDEDIYQSIEVTFSDSSINRPVRIRDYYNFAYGALGEHGAIFASHSHIGTQQKLENSDEIDTNRNGVIFYRPFDSWAVNSEWTYTLMTGEEPTCVAIGKRYCAVATTSKYGVANIRMFGYSGIQRAVLCVSGPIVSMTGYSDKLAVVYHKSNPIGNNQQLQCIVYDIKASDIQLSSNKYNCTVLYDNQLPLSPNSSLHWLDFSNKSMLLAYDTNGVLRGLSSVWSNQWTALLYTDSHKKHKTDFFWPIGCIDDKLMYVQCKTTTKQPSTVPKPVLQHITLQLPLLALNDGVSAMEEQYQRHDIITSQNWSSLTHSERMKLHATGDKLLLQLINRAVTGTMTKEVRSLDLSSMISLHKSLQVAIQIVTKANKSNVASRMGLLLESKFTGTDTSTVDELGTDKYSIESFIELEKQKDALKQARLSSKNNVQSSPNGTAVYDDDGGEAEMPAAKRGRLRRGSDTNDDVLPKRKNQAAAAEKENRTFADINTNIIDTNVNKNAKQGKLFAKETPTQEYKAVNKVVAPINPFAKKS